MIHRDLFEQLAIERRRKNEEDRKKRIFDPKMRIKGVNFAAIPEQIKEKEERKSLEKERHHLFDLQCSEINQLLERIDLEIKQRKVRELYKLNEFRREQKREDVLTSRVKIDSENPHASNCQSFVGDDLDKAERTKKQHEQMKVWVTQQVWEREEIKRRQKEEELAFKAYQDELIQSLEEIERKKAELIRERNQRDVEHNLKLATFKKERDLEEMEDRYFGHIQIMNNSKLGDLIFETPLSKKRSGQQLVSEYKGMSEQEILEIRNHQLKQKSDREERERKQKEEEYEYAEYQDRVIKIQNLLDLKKQEIVKEQNRLQEQVNDMLRDEYKRRNQKIIESPFQPFFSTFNQSSR